MYSRYPLNRLFQVHVSYVAILHDPHCKPFFRDEEVVIEKELSNVYDATNMTASELVKKMADVEKAEKKIFEKIQK